MALDVKSRKLPIKVFGWMEGHGKFEGNLHVGGYINIPVSGLQEN